VQDSLSRESPQTIDLAETMAMVVAEVGRYDEAVSWQARAIRAAERDGLAALVQEMKITLERYRRGEPCRTPWTARHDLPLLAESTLDN
jgi:hypothetical protein